VTSTCGSAETINTRLRMTAKTKINVGIVCESRLLRESLIMRLRRERDLVVTEALDGTKHMPRLWGMNCEVVMIQYHCRCVAMLQSVSKVVPGAKLVVIDADPAELDIVACLQLGVAGFILRDAVADDIVDAVRVVARGERVVPDGVTTELCLQLYDRGEKSNRSLSIGLTELTEREQQVARLIVEGLSNKEIANKLALSTSTVKCHVHNILDKLQVRSRIDLVNFFWREGRSSAKALVQAV
jgi:DNA-binding NarL/FixJ family response regulator